MPASATVALVQQALGDGSGVTSITATLGSAPTNGNFLAMVCGSTATASNITGISQTGVTWTAAVSNYTNATTTVYYGTGVSSAGTVATVSMSLSTTIHCNLSEWSGMASSSVFDSTNTGTGANSATSNTATSLAVTPTAAANVLLLTGLKMGGTLSLTGGGFTLLSTGNSGYQFAYQIVASASGAYQASWGSTASVAYSTIIAIFKGTGGGTPAASGFFLVM